MVHDNINFSEWEDANPVIERVVYDTFAVNLMIKSEDNSLFVCLFNAKELIQYIPENYQSLFVDETLDLMTSVYNKLEFDEILQDYRSQLMGDEELEELAQRLNDRLMQFQKETQINLMYVTMYRLGFPSEVFKMNHEWFKEFDKEKINYASG